MRCNPEIEAANQGQRSLWGNGEAVRMGTAATILLPQISRPVGPAWSSGLAGAFEIPMRTAGAPAAPSPHNHSTIAAPDAGGAAMKWEGQEQSSNVEDRRGAGPAAGGA